MIRENQKLLNNVNMFLDGAIIFCSMLLAFWIRFEFFPDTRHKLELEYYIVAALGLLIVQLFAYKSMGIYEALRRNTLVFELGRMVTANTICLVFLLMVFFVIKMEDFSRGVLTAFYVLENFLLGSKRTIIRLMLRRIRKHGYNKKYILIVGSGEMAQLCEQEINASPELGYEVQGYVSENRDMLKARCLGGVEQLEILLEAYRPDEVIAALETDEYHMLPGVIRACEACGVRFSLIPCYAKYMPVRPQVDSLNGIPILNLRKIPLDNAANAFVKRSMDIAGALFCILLFSPLMLFAAIGVKLSSPGPIIFKQARVGLGKEIFFMYKFRSMRVNKDENTGWSTNDDPRRTKFGSFIRKYSIDELPQFFNVLKGDMSLVGPRPELPHFVEQFRDDIPLYMVKHQVRPGITGWAQVHGFRGDTSIAERIKHDIYYIEHWSVLLDIQILLMTLRHVKNEEVLV